jgi:DNA-binding CsgD family transcriptional regulator
VPTNLACVFGMANSVTADRLISGIYDAIPPERGWQDCLDDFVRAVGGHSGTILWREGMGPPVLTATSGIDMLNHVDRYLKEFEALNPFHTFFASQTPGDLAAVGPRAFSKQYLKSTYFNEWAKPQGIGDLLAGHLVRGPSAHCWLSVRRDYKRGPYSAGELSLARDVAPHLVRALKLWARLRSIRGEGTPAAAALDAFACAVIVVDAEARILHTNRLAEALLSQQKTLVTLRGQVAAPRHDETTALRAAIRLAAHKTFHDQREGVVAVHNDDQELSIVHVIPLSADGRWGGLGNRAAIVGLFVADRGRGQLRALGAFISCYRLTPMEGRVLAQILTGGGLTKVAEDLAISVTTARSHLQQVFAKTGASKQAELVRMYFQVTVSL